MRVSKIKWHSGREHTELLQAHGELKVREECGKDAGHSKERIDLWLTSQARHHMDKLVDLDPGNCQELSIGIYYGRVPL